MKNIDKIVLMLAFCMQLLFATEYKLGVVLVEFSDIKHSTNNTVNDFENMMFGTGTDWISDEYSSPHPDGQDVFGSFEQYWNQQTNNQVTFSSESGIVYPSGSSDPWWELNHKKSYYDSLYGYTKMYSDLNLYSLISDSGYKKLAIIYAGDTYYNHKYDYGFIGDSSAAGLWPRGGGNRYILGEEHNGVFTHIGGHCHEFGHTIDLRHLADGSTENNNEVDYFALMEVGGMTGPNYLGACPAGINPFYKIKRGWVDASDVTYITQSTQDLTIPYSYSSPKYYVVNRNGNLSGNFYILENRLRQGFDLWTANDPNYTGVSGDPNGNEGGLLIWRVEQSPSYWIHLIVADNEVAHSDASYSKDPFPVTQGQSIDDYSTPSTQYYYPSVKTSKYAFRNITWNSTAKTVTVDVYTNSLSGTISSNTTWSSDVYVCGDLHIEDNVSITVNGNIKVASGVSLTIDPGATFTFDNGKRLDVYGSIEVGGTAANPVTFTSSGTWNGVALYSAGTSNFDYCEIEKAQIGLILTGSSPDITGCYIHDNNNYGLYIGQSSHPVFHNNTISDNGSDGIFIEYSCNPQFGTVSSSNEGSNVIASNSGDGLNITGSCTVFMGLVSGSTIYGGRNSVYGHSTNNDEISVRSNSSVVAHKNYWGTNPSFYYDGTSSLNTYSPLSTDPNDPDGGSPLAKGFGQITEIGNDFDPGKVDQNNPEDLFLLGVYNLCVSDKNKTISIFKDIVERFPDSKYAMLSLSQLEKISSSSSEKFIESYLNGKINEVRQSEKLVGAATDLLILHYLKEKNYKKLKMNLSKSEKNLYTNDLLSYYALIIANKKENPKEAEKNLSEMKQKYGDENLTRLACRMMDEKVDWSSGKQELKKGVIESANLVDTASDFFLYPAYPNPFNPSTNLSFSLEKQSKVDIRIYNLQGQEVWSWGNNLEYGSGYHSTVWKGFDGNGSQLSSGVYFIKLIANNQVATQKVIFMK